MSYPSIIKDVNGKPVPQYYNEANGEFEVATGINNCVKVILADNTGTSINLQSSVNQIKEKIDELIEVVK